MSLHCLHPLRASPLQVRVSTFGSLVAVHPPKLHAAELPSVGLRQLASRISLLLSNESSTVWPYGWWPMSNSSSLKFIELMCSERPHRPPIVLNCYVYNIVRSITPSTVPTSLPSSALGTCYYSISHYVSNNKFFSKYKGYLEPLQLILNLPVFWNNLSFTLAWSNTEWDLCTWVK